MHYESSIDVEATPEQVWSVLADATEWPTWDSGVLRVDGTVAEGSEIALTSSVAPTRAFKLAVTELRPPRRMVFTGGMPLGLFRGVRTYDVAPAGATTRFTMREHYSGPLAGMITRSMPDLQPSFDQFAVGLKARVEGASST